MIRPVGQYLIIVACLLLLFSWNHWKEVLKRIAVFCSGWVVVVAPWLIRNWLLTGYIFFHTLGGGHFLTLSAARVVMQERQCTYEESLAALRRELDNKVITQQNTLNRPLQEIEVCCCGEQLSVEYFKRYPLTSIKLWIHDLTKTVLGLYSSELLYLASGKQHEDFFTKDRTLLSCFIRYLHPKTHPWSLKIIIWLETLLYLLILVGLFLQFLGIIIHLISSYRFPPIVSPWFRTMPFIAALILLAFVCGYARLRVPVEPLLIILACAYWDARLTQ
ncbi:hypothetical protein JW872_00810 [Candidatus Babeliales bacterium]|nr:hypothetical protein [Candidatus Babeliales bacterium]